MRTYFSQIFQVRFIHGHRQTDEILSDVECSSLQIIYDVDVVTTEHTLSLNNASRNKQRELNTLHIK